MAMTVMTPEWKHVADDIMIFVLRNRMRDETQFQSLAQSPRLLFNQWANSRGTAIQNAELALWCVNYLRKLADMPIARLKKAAEIDGLKY